MDPTLVLGLMKKFINKNISRYSASSSDIIAFLRVELLMLSFYKVRRSKCQDRSHDKVRISRLADYRFPTQCTLILLMLLPSRRQRMECQVLDTAES